MSANDFVPEAGTRPVRIEFVREDTRGQTPSDPDWQPYSDHVENFWGWEPDANKQAEQPVGSPDPDFTDAGSETHEGDVQYWLQRWFVDGSGNAQDPAADAMLLDADNRVNNTHSTVSRMDISNNGADGAGYRIYHVGKGGTPTETTVPFEVDDGSPPSVQLSYQWEKKRTYRIDQPASSTTLDVTNNGSTSVDVTLEDEGAATTETVTVSGGSTVTSVESFGDIDAVELSTDTDGDVVVTDGAGTEFTRIKGSDSYTTEGDLGVPALGSGSHAGTVGTDYIIFNDDDYQYSTEEIAAEIISGELTVGMEVGDNSQVGTARRATYSDGRRATWTATVAGESTSVDMVADYLTSAVHDIEWVAGEGKITGPNAEHFSPGTSDFEAGSGKHERSIELQSQGVNLS